MHVKLLREWRGYRLGRILEMPAGQADMLERRGFAMPVGSTAEPRTRQPRRLSRAK